MKIFISIFGLFFLQSNAYAELGATCRWDTGDGAIRSDLDSEVLAGQSVSASPIRGPITLHQRDAASERSLVVMSVYGLYVPGFGSFQGTRSDLGGSAVRWEFTLENRTDVIAALKTDRSAADMQRDAGFKALLIVVDPNPPAISPQRVFMYHLDCSRNPARS